MRLLNKREALLLFAGDIAAFLLALWLMLLIRYGRLPTLMLLENHLAPFLILFAVWVLIFFIAGLYEKHTLILKSRLPSIILRAALVNSVVAVIFFYYIPYFGITPKTNLFIYLLVSFLLTLLWRMRGYNLFRVSHRRQNAFLVGSGEEMREVREEVNNNPRYGITFISSIDLDRSEGVDWEKEVLERVYAENVSVMVIDLDNEKVAPILPHLYNLLFSRIQFMDMHRIYEDIFDRIPLSLVRYNWFLENISLTSKEIFDALKRFIDITLSFTLGAVSLLTYPFVYAAIKLDDGGPIFIKQERVGQNGKHVRILKFRSMKINDQGDEAASKQNATTRAGRILRKTRIDELPQLWSVFWGDLSLIGPRMEMPSLVKLYEKEIPYYNVRHLVKPGLSGWAQIHQEAPAKFNALTDSAVHTHDNKIKLSYDLYYLKNRGMLLDLKIALRTVKVLLSRSGI
jgi:exopolysaccharide biosynthesis polyprenyl glycosylphosphotransferase